MTISIFNCIHIIYTFIVLVFLYFYFFGSKDTYWISHYNKQYIRCKDEDIDTKTIILVLTKHIVYVHSQNYDF